MALKYIFNPFAGNLDAVIDPTEAIAHADLSDMPDSGGTNTDHDLRYWTLGTNQTLLTGNKSGSFDLSTTGTINSKNLSGTNTGDQDLSGYLTNITEESIFDLSDFPTAPASNKILKYIFLDNQIVWGDETTPNLDSVLTAGSTSASNSITLTAGTLTAEHIVSTDDADINDVLTTGSLVTDTGGITILAGQNIKPSKNSTSAINISQADGTNFVSFDTTNKRAYFGNGYTAGTFSTPFQIWDNVNNPALTVVGMAKKTPFFIGRAANGTAGSPSSVTTDTRLFAMGGGGWGGSGWVAGSMAQIRMCAAENWTATKNGTYLDFWTTTSGGSTIEKRLTITDAGQVELNGDKYVYFGAANDARIGFSGTKFILQSDLVTSTDALQLRGGTNGTEFNIGTTQQMLLTDGVLAPTTDNDIDLGIGGSKEFKDIHAKTIRAKHYAADDTAPVADGTYIMGLGGTTNGTITIKDGIITAVQECVA